MANNRRLTIPARAEVRAWVASQVRQLGHRQAARLIGISREATLAIAAGLSVRPGTNLMAQQAMERARET